MKTCSSGAKMTSAKILTGFLIICLMSACAGGQWSSDKLTPMDDRISDEAIALDLSLIEQWNARANKIEHDDEDADRTYGKAKARAMLEFTKEEYTDNDRTGVVDDAFQEATRMVTTLEAGREVSLKTGQLTGTERVRADLWARGDALKAGPGFPCAAEVIARMEVALLWAGNEEFSCAYDERRTHENRAEALADEAEALAATCIPEPEPEPEPEPVVTAPELEVLTVHNNVHFGLNKDVIEPSSAGILNDIADVLNKYPNIQVTLYGHTDKRGSYEYNLALSKRRTQSTHDYLASFGIASERITQVPQGQTDLKTEGDDKVTHARNRRVQLVFFTGQGVRIEPLDQESDLHIED